MDKFKINNCLKFTFEGIDLKVELVIILLFKIALIALINYLPIT